MIKEIKKILHKTLGRSHLSYEAFESVVVDVERILNNRPLTYVKAEGGEDEVLTPNTIPWGRDVYQVEDKRRNWHKKSGTQKSCVREFLPTPTPTPLSVNIREHYQIW